MCVCSLSLKSETETDTNMFRGDGTSREKNAGVMNQGRCIHAPGFIHGRHGNTRGKKHPENVSIKLLNQKTTGKKTQGEEEGQMLSSFPPLSPVQAFPLSFLIKAT